MMIKIKDVISGKLRNIEGVDILLVEVKIATVFNVKKITYPIKIEWLPIMPLFIPFHMIWEKLSRIFET